MKGVQLTKLAQELNLTNLTPDIDLTEIYVKTAEINRPALQLTGYLEHFANERVQIIGYVEYTYLMQLSDEERTFKYERFISSKIPCVIFSTMTRPSQDMIDLAYKYNVPTFVTERTTRPAGSLYFHSRCACGCLWRGCPDHRRERYW